MTDLQRAQTLATTLPPSEERRQLAYIARRLSAPVRDEEDELDRKTVHKRLADILRSYPAPELQSPNEGQP